MKVRISHPLVVSHSLSVRSMAPDSAALPSGENATEMTSPECPVKVKVDCMYSSCQSENPGCNSIKMAPAPAASLDFSNISVHRGRESEKDVVLQQFL